MYISFRLNFKKGSTAMPIVIISFVYPRLNQDVRLIPQQNPRFFFKYKFLGDLKLKNAHSKQFKVLGNSLIHAILAVVTTYIRSLIINLLCK